MESQDTALGRRSRQGAVAGHLGQCSPPAFVTWAVLGAGRGAGRWRQVSGPQSREGMDKADMLGMEVVRSTSQISLLFADGVSES